MTWTKFDQAASVHAKCVLAGNDAASFWQWAVQWANRNNTDGYLDSRLLHTIPPVPIAKELAKDLANACVDAIIKPGGAGLFEEAVGGYLIHDFHHFQPPADGELKDEWLSNVRSQAGKKGADKRWQNEKAKREAEKVAVASRARASDRIGSDGSDRSGSGEGEGSGGQEARESGTTRVLSDEAVTIATEIRKFPIFENLEIARIANEHAGRMMARPQRMEAVLDAIGDCAAKLTVSTPLELKHRTLVGFLRHAGTRERGGGAGGGGPGLTRAVQPGAGDDVPAEIIR